jgi:hypothetical protein
VSQRREALTYIVSSGFLALFPFVFGMARWHAGGTAMVFTFVSIRLLELARRYKIGATPRLILLEMTGRCQRISLFGWKLLELTGRQHSIASRHDTAQVPAASCQPGMQAAVFEDLAPAFAGLELGKDLGWGDGAAGARDEVGVGDDAETEPFVVERSDLRGVHVEILGEILGDGRRNGVVWLMGSVSVIGSSN